MKKSTKQLCYDYAAGMMVFNAGLTKDEFYDWETSSEATKKGYNTAKKISWPDDRLKAMSKIFLYAIES